MKTKKIMAKSVDGENILYHILQKQIIQAFDAVNPPDHVKYMIEQLMLWGGVWFKPETCAQIPIMLPYVVRDSSCRRKNPATGKDSWGMSNARGFLRDDNSLIKSIPRSLKIQSAFSEMNGRTMGNGFVASHIWMSMRTRSGHACEWECANSFIPNLVWLPKQLSKLTDIDGSYAQQFLKYISGMLYKPKTSSDPVLAPIWKELNVPSIEPISEIDLGKLNYFEHDINWLSSRKSSLVDALQSILDTILFGASKTIRSSSRYISSLKKVLTSMSNSDRQYLEDWIKCNLDILKAVPCTFKKSSHTTGVKTPSVGLSAARASRFYTINGAGMYKMHQVIGEYIIFKLEGGKTFLEIHDEISKNAKFVSDKQDGVSVNNSRHEKPHFVEYKGTKYYITTQLRNRRPNENFSVFMRHVNETESDFQISPC